MFGEQVMVILSNELLGVVYLWVDVVFSLLQRKLGLSSDRGPAPTDWVSSLLQPASASAVGHNPQSHKRAEIAVALQPCLS